MYFDEPMSTDNTSNMGYNAKTNPRNHFCPIDDEAEESSEGSSSEYGFRDGDTAPGAFSQFVQLPPELRHQIWHFYCPDLSVKARVLPFMKWPGSTIPDRRNNSSVSDHSALADQTRNLRVMLSTHRESRSIAVRKYPNELTMNAASGTSIVRFRKETDVIFLIELLTDVAYSVPDFGNEIENLAVGLVEDKFSAERYFDNETILKVLPAIKGLFPNLRRLFSHWPAMTQPTDMEEWCVTECVHSYMVKTYRGREPDLDEHTDTLFCWPDLDAHPDFVRSLVPKMCSLEEMEETGVEFWPIVEFESETSMQMYDMMRRLYWNRYFTTNGGDSPDSEDDYNDYNNADGTDVDQYGSEGIDHGEIVELDGSSESELFSCLRSDNVQLQALAQFDVEHHSRPHKRKAIALATEDDEEDGMGHVHDEDGKPQNKRARLSRPIPGFDDEEEEEEEDLKPDQGEIKSVSTRRVMDRSWNLFIFSHGGI
ncbi:hypothetical protein E4U60_007893 [Claviceps pazoutovae]|uniref:2EXR domain-containing protein n=1 Tax=Claviceps pazoutovae TaxID=1649127 RepID=A0A9P7SIT6_9HYPO|nr:hypothetical protein E4U60_007893 [Claviceps pazoutovae]